MCIAGEVPDGCDVVPIQTPIYKCLEKDIDYGYHIIKSVKSLTVEECQRLCQADDKCRYFTFLDNDKMCQLKGVGAMENRSYYKGVVSGPKWCPGEAPATAPLTVVGAVEEPIPCFEQNISYQGGDIFYSRLDSAEKCQRYCQEVESCFFFTWVSSHQWCYLMDKKPPTRKPDDGRISGPKWCRNRTATVTVPTATTTAPLTVAGTVMQRNPCFEQNIAYVGSHLSASNLDSAEECQRHCQEVDRCFFFSWSKKRCFLKTITPPTRRADDSFISGPKWCLNKTVTVTTPTSMKTCFEKGIGYGGTDISVSHLHSAEECQRHCQEVEMCFFFTWVSSNRWCYLMGEKPPTRNAYDDHISGPKWCLTKVGTATIPTTTKATMTTTTNIPDDSTVPLPLPDSNKTIGDRCGGSGSLKGDSLYLLVEIRKSRVYNVSVIGANCSKASM